MTPKKSMKKLLITIPFLFLAAACNKQTAQVQPVQNQPAQTAQQQVQPAQVQPQATSTDETANWKTYTNATYGFQLNYPSDWSVREYGQKDNYFIIFSQTSPVGNFQIQIRDLSTSADGQAELKNRQSQINSNITDLSGTAVSHLTVGGFPAMKLYVDLTPTLKQNNVLFLNGNEEFNIAEQPMSTDSALFSQSIQLMDSVLSTFKFTK